MLLSKQTLKLGVVMVALTLILAACGGNQSNNGGSGAGAANGNGDNKPKQEAGSNQTEAPKTKIYKAENGDIEVPVNPERIVAITFLGDLLALGVTPVGAGSIALDNSVLLKEELSGVTSVGDVSVEAVMDLEPDLIIVPSYLPGETVEQLVKIAPTVAIPWFGFTGTDPLDQVKTIGDLIGKEAEAEAFIARYKEKAAEAKARIAGAIRPDETVGSYSIWAKSFWVLPKGRDAGYNLLEMFGLTPQAKVNEEVIATGEGKDISLEVVPEYAADHMFVTVYEPDGGSERAKEIMEGSLWSNLDAVKNNHVYMLDMTEFWMNDGLNLEKQLDILVDIILAQNK